MVLASPTSSEPTTDPAQRDIGRSTKQWRLGAAGVLLLAVAVFSWFLVAGDGYPYVTDNNESYSSLGHARNLLTFGFARSCGLADDTGGPQAAAHPFVHTHQGNLPRVFATLIYLLGAQTIESQIAVTTFTVGLASILMAYLLFSRITNPTLAVLACVFLLTDYLMFAQWQVATYRVWYTFLVFSTLHCMHGLGGRRRRWWMLLTIANFTCLYYFEYVFAIFVTVSACAYALMLYWRKWRIFLPAAGASALGAVLGCSILLTQLIAYMGVEGVLYDAWLTFNARNASAEISQQAREFYNSHNIIFWENYAGGAQYRDINAFMRSMFTYNVGLYSPLFVLIVCMLLTGVSVSMLESRLRRLPIWNHRSDGSRTSWRALLGAVARFRPGRFAMLCTGWCILLIVLLRDRSFAGFAAEDSGGLMSEVGANTFCALVAAFFVCGLNNLTATGSWWIGNRVPWHRIAIATSVLIFFSVLIRKLGRWCSPAFVPIWNELDDTWMYRIVGRLLVVFAAAVAVALLMGRWRHIARQINRLSGFRRFFLAGMTGYTMVYFLSAGYVHSGYLVRWAPFLVFFTNPLVALTIYVLATACRLELRRVHRWRRSEAFPWRRDRPRTGWLPIWRETSLFTAPIGAAAALLLFLAAYWTHLQLNYVALLPPDQRAVFNLLRRQPFRDKSFVVNTYAMPAACETGQWAYYDPRFGSEPVELGPDGYRVAQDTETYLWYADRDSNSAYMRPEYFLYVTYQDPTVTPLQRQLARTPEAARASPLTQCANRICRDDGPLQNRVVSRDPSGRDRWMIIELDWEFPPYLKPLGSQPEKKVDTRVSSDSQGVHVHVAYRYAHQDGVPEYASRVRLYRVHVDAPRELLAEQRGDAAFDLPAAFQGNLQASVVPCTAKKEGEESFSRIFRIGDVPALAAPYLARLEGDTPRTFVQAELVHAADGPLLKVDYAFRHDDGEEERGTLVRLYVESPDGALSLWSEMEDLKSIPIGRDLWRHAAERNAGLRVSVTPHTPAAGGQEYFCNGPVSLETLFRPYLHVLPGGRQTADAGRKHVQVVVSKSADGAELNVVYAYGHPAGVQENGTTLRVYCQREDGTFRLAKQESDVRQIRLGRLPGRRLRVSVTPSDGKSAGPEYFSETLDIGQWR